jgi:hypothetical protein
MPQKKKEIHGQNVEFMAAWSYVIYAIFSQTLT